MKPLQLNEDMQKELIDDIAKLSSNGKDTHDAVGAVFGPPSLRRRLATQSDSEGAESVPQDDTKVIEEDPVNPSHYRRHPSGIECIEIARHMNFNCGNALKYIWRYMDKGDPVENLKKAQWYLDDEIRRLQGQR